MGWGPLGAEVWVPSGHGLGSLSSHRFGSPSGCWLGSPSGYRLGSPSGHGLGSLSCRGLGSRIPATLLGLLILLWLPLPIAPPSPSRSTGPSRSSPLRGPARSLVPHMSPARDRAGAVAMGNMVSPQHVGWRPPRQEPALPQGTAWRSTRFVVFNTPVNLCSASETQCCCHCKPLPTNPTSNTKSCFS